MLHKACSSIEEVPYCFSRSSIKFQGHTALKIVEFDPNWPFPDCNYSLNSPMAMKCCTKLQTAKERCPIVFQGHPSNFKVTWDKTSGQNITDFDPNCVFPDYRPVAAFKSLRFALFPLTLNARLYAIQSQYHPFVDASHKCFSIIDKGSISLTIFHHNSHSLENLFCMHLSCNEMIIRKFCIWHDSCAVACAKFSSAMIPYNEVRLKPIFNEFELQWKKTF